MTTTAQRISFPSEGQQQPHKRDKAWIKDADSKGIWLSMLDDVSRGKDLAEKQLISLGGTPIQQREFLSTLHPPQSINTTNANRLRNQHKATTTTTPLGPLPTTNTLSYAYHDVPDTDAQDILARLSTYTLPSPPSSAFIPLLRPLFSVKSVPNTLVTILLDWAQVFQWPTQLREWVRVLRAVREGLDESVSEVMEEVMTGWRERRLGFTTGGERPAGPGAGVGAAVGADGNINSNNATSVIPLGPGEWDDDLGVPLCVVCLNAEKEERMEKEYGWQEGDFDFVLQWMRCVLLKHGASLIYTTSFDSNHVRTLIHSSLGIQSLLKRETIKHNVIDRDRILIPPNWDSWGKIRILRDGFEMETIAKAWSVEIQQTPEKKLSTHKTTNHPNNTTKDTSSKTEQDPKPTQTESTTSIFLSSLPNPFSKSKPFIPSATASDLVTVQDTQTFLATQAEILDSFHQEDERAATTDRSGARRGAGPSKPKPKPSSSASASASASTTLAAASSAAATTAHPPPSSQSGHTDDNSSSHGHIPDHRHHQPTPYNINIGGIQIDAEEVTRRIREREADRDRDGGYRSLVAKEPGGVAAGGAGQGGGGVGGGGGGGAESGAGAGKIPNEALASYFAGLMKKAKASATASGTVTPGGGGAGAGGGESSPRRESPRREVGGGGGR